MISKWRRYGTTVLLAVVMVMWGCDTPTEPAPQSPVQEVSASSDLLGGLLGAVDDVLDTSVDLVRTTVRVVGSVGDALIGPVGGLLSVDDHDLVVPPGAVAHPAKFSMEVIGGRNIEVDLRAIDPETGEDVGEKGFLRPVQLSLSYEDARIKDSDVDELVIVRLHEDGTREVLPSSVNRETKQITAELDHFSRYALCRN